MIMNHFAWEESQKAHVIVLPSLTSSSRALRSWPSFYFLRASYLGSLSCVRLNCWMYANQVNYQYE